MIFGDRSRIRNRERSLILLLLATCLNAAALAPAAGSAENAKYCQVKCHILDHEREICFFTNNSGDANAPEPLSSLNDIARSQSEDNLLVKALGADAKFTIRSVVCCEDFISDSVTIEPGLEKNTGGSGNKTSAPDRIREQNQLSVAILEQAEINHGKRQCDTVILCPDNQQAEIEVSEGQILADIFADRGQKGKNASDQIKRIGNFVLKSKYSKCCGAKSIHLTSHPDDCFLHCTHNQRLETLDLPLGRLLNIDEYPKCCPPATIRSSLDASECICSEPQFTVDEKNVVTKHERTRIEHLLNCCEAGKGHIKFNDAEKSEVSLGNSKFCYKMCPAEKDDDGLWALDVNSSMIKHKAHAYVVKNSKACCRPGQLVETEEFFLKQCKDPLHPGE
ncbi:MAG: hypothetical protein MHMPM18_002535 [Marteilia pararefringens]